MWLHVLQSLERHTKLENVQDDWKQLCTSLLHGFISVVFPFLRLIEIGGDAHLDLFLEIPDFRR